MARVSVMRAYEENVNGISVLLVDLGTKRQRRAKQLAAIKRLAASTSYGVFFARRIIGIAVTGIHKSRETFPLIRIYSIRLSIYFASANLI